MSRKKEALRTYLNVVVTQELEGITIYSDSRSDIEAIKNVNNKVTQEINKLLKQLKCLY